MDDTAKQAEYLFLKEQYDYIIYLYASIIKDNNSNNIILSEVYKRKGVCYEKINKYNEAIEDYRKSIKLNKNNSSVYMKLSNCYLLVGKTNEAEEILKEMPFTQRTTQEIENEKMKLEQIEIKEKLIKDAYEKNNYDQVVGLINKLSLELQEHLNIKTQKIFVSQKILKAECLIYLSKFNDSLQIINEILSKDRYNYDAIFMRGLNLLHQGKYIVGLENLKEAMNVCQRSKQYYEKYKNFQHLIKKAHELQNTNPDEARIIYLQLLETDPKNKYQNNIIYYELAKICYAKKKYDDVIIYSTEILFDDEKNLNGLKLRAKAYEKTIIYEDALEDCKEIVKIENSEKNIMFLNKINVLYSNNIIDNYARLGVKKGAGLLEITRIWRQLCRKYHPDKNVESRAQQFIAKRQLYRINKAYRELKEMLD